MTARQNSNDSPTSGRQIPESAFAHDDGSAPGDLIAALAAVTAGNGQGREVLTVLARGRLLVPIVAVADSTQSKGDGLQFEKDSHLATVLVQSPNGEKAMLAFSSSEAMAKWRPDARPAPISGIAAAQTALAEGATTLLVDISGPTPFAVTAGDLRALAGAIDLDTARGLVSELVEAIPGLVHAHLETTNATPDLVVTVDPSLSEASYRELLATLSQGLRSNQRLAQIFAGGLRIQIVAPGQKR